MTRASTPLPTGFRFAVLDDTGDIAGYNPNPSRYYAQFAFVLLVLEGVHEAGYGEFYHDFETRHLMCSDVSVRPEYRRRGLASALYLEAERLSSKIIHPYSEQYPDGRAMWLSPHRQWGRGVTAPTTPTIEEGS